MSKAKYIARMVNSSGDVTNTSLTNSLDLKAPLASPTFTGTVSGITKSMVGLGNVDNTTDLLKPISTVTQTALDLKAPLASPTFTGTVTGVSKSMVGLGNVDNTTDANKPVSTATQTALDLKSPLASPTFTGTVNTANLAYTGTLTGSTGILNIGSGQLYKDASGNVGIGTSSPAVKLDVVGAVKLGASNAGWGVDLYSNTNWNYSNLNLRRNAANTATPRFISFMLDGDSDSSTTIGGFNAIWGSYDSAPTTGSTSSGLNGKIVYGAYAGHQWYTNGTPRMCIDSSGNVGIGTSSPGAKIQVSGAGETAPPSTSGAKTATIYVTANQNSANCGGAIEFGGQSNTTFAAWKGGLTDGTSNTLGYLAAYTRNATSNTSMTERLRIDESGNLLVGTTSVPSVSGVSGNNFNVSNTTNNGSWSVFQSTGATVNRGIAISYSNAAPNDSFNEFVFCKDSVTTRFAVKSNGGISNFSANNTNLSDERTKKDITNAGDYLAKICAIPVRTFLYKDQADTDLNLGVIAQEVEAVAPELVDNSGFGEPPADGIPLKAIYQTDLQYALMKCIQELKVIIDTQQEQINFLLGK